MIRLIAIALFSTLLAACSLSPFQRGDQARVVASSQYCGTASQDSDVRYFGDDSVFEDWIDYRNITEFSPSLAASGGIIVVEMGQRPTGGYQIKLVRDDTTIDDDTLTLHMQWSAPRLDAAVSQALIAPCVAIDPPPGRYRLIRVVDQLGNLRGKARVR